MANVSRDSTDSFQLIMVILKKIKKIKKCDQGSLFSRIITISGAFATVYSQNRALLSNNVYTHKIDMVYYPKISILVV